MIDRGKTIEARHVATDLSVADLNNPAWENATSIPLTRYWSGAPAPPGRHAEGRVLWSDKALHLRYVCRQTEPPVISPKPETKAKVMGLWDRDVCEIFIAPDPNVIEQYFEIEAAPNGEWLDVAIQWTPEKRESDWKFHSGMTVAAQVENERVIIAMRIPWSHRIHKPKTGERWRVNLFRCVGRDPDRGYLAWQPTHAPQPNFHVPQVFGWLIFK